jgi:hypothetical protein
MSRGPGMKADQHEQDLARPVIQMAIMSMLAELAQPGTSYDTVYRHGRRL